MASIFQDHPFNKGIHPVNAKRIASAFPQLAPVIAADHLALVAFLDTAPQRFYSRKAFTAYFDFLSSAYRQQPRTVLAALSENADAVDLSHRVLAEVDQMPLHDTYVPEDALARIKWIDEEINQLLLRLWEASLHGFLLVHEQVRRRTAKVSLENMDIYNVVQGTERTPLVIAKQVYDHNMRNGIGHGKVRFNEDSLSYTDKKGSKVKRTVKEVARTFDDLVDVLHGFTLAHQLFWAINKDELSKAGLQLPRSVLFEELKARVNMPGWNILACLESERRSPKRQLEIHLRNKHWDFNKVQYWGFYTAYWAERLTGSFESVFLHFRSSSSNAISWAGYNAERMRELRAAGTSDIAAYKGVLEGDLMFFIPKVNLPKWLLKVGTLYMAFRGQFSAWKAQRRADRIVPFVVRHCAIHAKWGYSILPDPVVIVNPPSGIDAQDFVRQHHRAIIRSTIRACRRSLPWHSIARYLPVRYARIMVHATDKRRRQLKQSGLSPELLGTVGFNTSKRIPNIEIATGTLEQQGRYRLLWNSRWRG